MRKNSTDFSTPQRQSIEGIALNISKTLNTLFRKILPALLVLLVGSKQGRMFAIIGMGVLAVFSIITSIISYFKYSFHIENDELVVHKGVWTKEKINIPFGRIQSVNFEQNILHQMLDVVAVKIETAGSKGSEIEMTSLKKDVALALREKLLSKRNQKTQEVIENKKEDEEVLLSLTLPELLRAGILENHLKSVGILLATVMGLYQNVKDWGFEDKVDENIEAVSGMIFFIAACIFVLIISFIISLVRMILNHYELKFTRVTNGFKIYGGLLKRKHLSALDHKIQTMSYADNPLKKLIGIYDLKLKQASSNEVKDKKSIAIPAVSKERIETVKNYLFKDLHLPKGRRKIQSPYWIRTVIFTLIGMVIALGVGYYLEWYLFMGAAVVFAGVIILTRYKSFQKKGVDYNEDALVIYGGSYGNRMTIVPIYKLQSLAIIQSPYQRRNRLANVVFYTAAGDLSIPYVTLQEAEEMFDYFTYLIEINKKPWI